MSASPAVPPVRGVEDRRRPAYGWGRLLVGVFAIFGLVAFVPALVGLVRTPNQYPVTDTMNLIGGLLYILLAVCVAHNGRRMRMVGWMSLSALATLAVLVGALHAAEPQAELGHALWADYSLPQAWCGLILPIIAGLWMWMSDPRRIVQAAERRHG